MSVENVLESNISNLHTGRLDHLMSDKVRGNLTQSFSNSVQVIVWQGFAQVLGQHSDDLPVLSGGTWSIGGSSGDLCSTLGVDICGRLFRVGSTRQDDIGQCGTVVTVVAW